MIGEGSVELPDGRRLGFAEYGNPTARPILYFHGHPGGRHWVPDGGIAPGTPFRFIALERPGFGLSSPSPNRSLLDWPRDVERFADALRLDRFAVAAWSAGGPYAVACANVIPDRVSAVGLISAAGPLFDHPEFDPLLRTDLQVGLPIARVDQSRAQELAGDYARPQVSAWQSDPSGFMAEWWVNNEPLSDRSLYYLQREHWHANLEATYGGGTQTTVDEFMVWLGPWNFTLEEIRVPLRAWHGTEDRVCPIEAIEYVVRHVPGASLVPYAGEAHFLSPIHHDEWAEFLLTP